MICLIPGERVLTILPTAAYADCRSEDDPDVSPDWLAEDLKTMLGDAFGGVVYVDDARFVVIPPETKP